MGDGMDSFKKSVLTAVFDRYNRFFLHAMPHPRLHIGKRGLTKEEEEKGIVLVFGEESYREFAWGADYFTVLMRFSGVWESLLIPLNSIVTIFDNPTTPDFIINFRLPKPEETVKRHDDEDHKVIKLDFKKKH